MLQILWNTNTTVLLPWQFRL